MKHDNHIDKFDNYDKHIKMLDEEIRNLETLIDNRKLDIGKEKTCGKTNRCKKKNIEKGNIRNSKNMNIDKNTLKNGIINELKNKYGDDINIKFVD